ncbi:unnamed protein product [Gongylonema pulchrum]|uniref:Condensin complex subunit 3 n=1 Tax=Gongylonema pulchrum TaxID=637853 RepID=A0A183CYS0_9BILA|nr:unnamed protein product [Gongylonema pulchrum]
MDWTKDRTNTLKLLRRTFSLNSIDAQGRKRNTAIRFLWQPSIVPPELLKISVDLAYKFLENPELGKVSGRDWLQAIFSYIKVICIDYNEAARRLSKSDFTRSDVSARPFALFIMTLAEKKPHLLNKHIVNIAPFLADDPSALRCAVLCAFVEIVMQVYKGNLPEGNFRRSRDRLLLHLQDHTADVNAVVRSRVLQLWTRLARASQIPIIFINSGLIRDIGGRLLDKSISLNADDLAVALRHLELERRELKQTNPGSSCVCKFVQAKK